MTRLQKFWAAIRETEERLEDDAYIVSIEDPRRGIRGNVTQLVDRVSAARQIVKGEARLADQVEIDAFAADQAQIRAKLLDAELARKGKTMVIVP